MLDFFKVCVRNPRKGDFEIYPQFIVDDTEDLMVRGGDFYAIWDEKKGLWSTKENTASRIIDREVMKYKKEKFPSDETDRPVVCKLMRDSDSGVIDKWHKYVQKQMRDSYHILDEKITFQNSDISKEDYVSRRLPYSIEEGDISAYEELISTLYESEERDKLEWAIGAIISGDAKEIQKFIVLYGSAGSGKSTVLNIIQSMFDGYCATFDAKDLTSSNNSFALESFKNNPLIAIQHDGDLSRIEDNTKLNSLVSHELMEVNEKYSKKYVTRFNAFLFMGTNKPVKITEAKSGIIRRLIDVRPSGRKIPFERYKELMHLIEYERGAIAYHCLEKYKSMGMSYYDPYIPKDMISATNDFYDFIENYYGRFVENDYISLKSAWGMYNEYCEYAKVTYPYTMRQVRVELQNYFKEFKEDATIDGKHLRSVYIGFLKDKFKYVSEEESKEEKPWLVFNATLSRFDMEYANCPAQYANDKETPTMAWDRVETTLAEIDTSKLHYVRVPENHIVIDFDIKDKDGNKDFDANYKAALKWPPTYAELSKSGAGIHLHYIYKGDVSKLSSVYDDSIEVKVFSGKSSLRRLFTKCCNLAVATITSGLPLKGEKNVVDFEGVKSEKALRTLIRKNLAKEIHPGTKPSVDFIFKILNDEYEKGNISFDLRDMRPAVLAFAANSTHQAAYCISLVSKMHFASKDIEEGKIEEPDDLGRTSSNYISKEREIPIVFFDVEVFPNLFVVCYKAEGENKTVTPLINPTPADIENLMKFRLVGFNNRRYDNHILYARLIGYTNEQLYDLSQKIVNGSRNAMFGQAYNVSYTDIYDFCSEKQSLKKWEIELGIHHQELGLPWDQPVPEEMWETVAGYCKNDVIATEAVWNARHEDFVARQILADISGLSVNDTNQQHTAKIIFGNDPKPQSKFIYTDLSTIFPGYKYDAGKSSYMGEDPGEGGYVYAEPGMYFNVALLDIASMHPNSLIQLNLFGDEYTANFKQLLDARIAIKHKDYEAAKKMLNGALAPYLTNPDDSKALSYALKIIINSVYGLTSAKFDNKFRDVRNIDNIVAKRGALFMINLKHEVKKRGYKVAHIKTDSIKIPEATPEIISFVMEYGKKYGYTFEHEATYEKLCLVNDAVYIAKYKDEPHWDEDYKKELWWTATGTQFRVPYVFKTLFTKDPIEFKDMCETKTVTSALYLDMNEDLPEGEHAYRFVGKAGLFCPIKKGCGGGILLREKDGKYYAATGSKGYRWQEAEVVKNLQMEDCIDRSYYNKLVDDAKDNISQYGDFEMFVSDDPVHEPLPDFMNIPETDEEELPWE